MTTDVSIQAEVFSIQAECAVCPQNGLCIQEAVVLSIIKDFAGPKVSDCADWLADLPEDELDLIRISVVAMMDGKTCPGIPSSPLASLYTAESQQIH